MTPLITDDQMAVLRANGQATRLSDTFDPLPVVKLFTPDAGATWLLCAVDQAEPDLAYGLCDLGLGAPEIGWVSLAEIQALRGHMNLPVVRDAHFHADRRLSLYAREARVAGRIMA